MKKLLFVLAASIAIMSCQKEEDTKNIDVSKVPYLMDKKWQLKGKLWLPDVNDTTSFYVDVYTNIAGCEKDNYFIFNTSNRVSLYQGDQKCDINAPDSTVMGYTLTQNDKHLLIFGSPDEDIEHPTILAGDAEYPSIDTFKITYTAGHPTTPDVTSKYVETYVKLK
jgi:hypothetical protein